MNKGQFISIDGRPISTTRGIFKDFTKTYKAYYKHWLPLKQKDFTADPFLCLHLRCPKGSYDVNIEPAKDEVLFSDARQVQKVLEDFLRSAYGALPVETSKKEFRDNRGLASIAEAQSFELLLAKKDGHPNARPENASQRNEGPDLGKGVGANEGKKSGLEVCHTRANNACRPTHEETQSPANDSFATDRRLHRNMYDFDEDDLGAVDPPLGLHGDADAKTDDAELRDVSLTNPWTLAKINAPVSSSTNQSSSVGRGIMNEQFMTPSDLERSGIASTTHMKTFNRITQLPSPLGSDSPYSSTSSPKLGSPLRRSLVPESEEDDIEYTQEPTNASSSYGHNLSSGLVLESMAHKLPSPSSNWSSESIDKGASLENHNALRSRGSGTEKEMSSTQLTDPVEDTMASLPSPSSIRKPFKPPFKTPEKPLALYPPLKLTPPTSPRLEQQLPRRQQTPSNASEGQNTNPPSHGHPPPLSQSHRHPMASPPRLQPSPPSLAKPLRQSTLTPNSDLEEIMDFEYRKKAINSQRKSQNKLTNRYLNPGHLAQLQRESRTSLQAPGPESFSSPFRKLAPPSVDLGDETDDSYNPPRALSRAGPELPPSFQEPANKPPQKQNPHHNRYQAARAALTRPNPRTSPSHAHPLTQNDESALETTISSTEEECLPPLPATDARAYLIQRRKSSHSPGHTLKRTKTSKLPLESIPTDSATYSLSVRPHDAFPSLQDLAIQARELGRVDTYTLSGENEFVKWNAKDLDVPVWEEKIARLVRERYVARLGGEGGEEVPANLQLRLGVVLKAHVEEFT